MIRISLVDYLNSAPLGWSFIHGPHQGSAEVVPAFPSKCAEQLATGEVDVGLIPVIEYQRIQALEVVPGIAVASTRAVRSVILVKRPRAPMRRVALDTSSRTSAALVRILLRLQWGLDPEFVSRRPGLESMLEECDAALLIGDEALRVPTDRYEITDLAEAWLAWQRLPFVFAFWACRSDTDEPKRLSMLLQSAKEWGVARRSEIAEAWSSRLGLPARFLLEYLVHNIDYDLSAAHVQGMERFFALAVEAGLISEARPVSFLSGSRPERSSVC